MSTVSFFVRCYIEKAYYQWLSEQREKEPRLPDSACMLIAFLASAGLLHDIECREYLAKMYDGKKERLLSEDL